MAANKRNREVVSDAVEIDFDADVDAFLDCLAAIIVRIRSGKKPDDEREDR